MSTTTERSIRLNQTHRADMANAVMEEWEKQNPPPAAAIRVALLEAVAEQVKKCAAYRRTLRLAAVMEPDDAKHLALEGRINIAVMNKQGEQRNTHQIFYPLSIAKRLGLTGVPGKHHTIRSSCFAPSDLEREDMHNPESVDLDRPNDQQEITLKCITFAETNYPVVQVDDDLPALVAMREARQARHEWEKQRDTLGRETRDLLDNFNTTKQLREGWPDIVPYLPPHLADFRGVNLPVLETSRLSERLGITDKEAS